VKWIFPLFVFTLPLLAQADIYKCVNEGKTTFSQLPCGETAQVVTVKPSKRNESSTASREIYTKQLNAIEIRIEIKKLEREISQLRTKKRSLLRTMDAELATLRQKKQTAANNLAGATWEASISSEMQSVSHSYKTKIETTQSRIDEANRNLERLRLSK
jgi:predicted RNase H-like nuclease (RuvC/YqgF family)